jgi:hypothetical protein
MIGKNRIMIYGPVNRSGPLGVNTLVTWPQDGRSYAISPGSLWTGAILSTSFIGLVQCGYATVPCLFRRIGHEGISILPIGR